MDHSCVNHQKALGLVRRVPPGYDRESSRDFWLFSFKKNVAQQAWPGLLTSSSCLQSRSALGIALVSAQFLLGQEGITPIIKHQC